MKMRLVILTFAVLLPFAGCATGEPPGSEATDAPAVASVPPEEPTPGRTPDAEPPAEAEPSEAEREPEDAPPTEAPTDPPTEAPTEAAAADPAVVDLGRDAPVSGSARQGSADSSTASVLHGDDGAPDVVRPPAPVSAPMVSEPWNHRREPLPIPGVIDDSDVVAFYGHPLSFYMGILGESPIEEMADRLREVAEDYDAINGDRRVVPAFHIIYATAYADANVGVLNSEVLADYIQFAEDNGFAVILDHQLGRHDVVESVRQMLPYLKYPSVHLAIDPEWSTLTPNEVIGSVHASEINEAQEIIQDYLEKEGIDQRKMFVVHQFNWVMIENRHEVRTDFDRVDLVHNADGFGPPNDKHRSWDHNRRATNIPLKGFKLFYPKEWRDGGYDDPLMSPEEVLALDPRPVLIMYQ
ncbi:MAG: hypothetical protein ACLFPV_13040 [Spirochaetaceae bacterium]